MAEPMWHPIASVVDDVRTRLDADDAERLARYLSRLRVDPESLAPYLHRHPTHYTRNLIFKSELSELLALCWGPGHRAWIHNHRGQQCWMAVTDGTLLVRNYRRLGCGQARRTVRLEPTVDLRIFPGSPAVVDAAEPVHAVWNPGMFFTSEHGIRSARRGTSPRPSRVVWTYSLSPSGRGIRLDGPNGRRDAPLRGDRKSEDADTPRIGTTLQDQRRWHPRRGESAVRKGS